MFQERVEQVRSKVKSLLEQYRAAHPQFNVPEIDIRFDLAGRVAGWAGKHRGSYFMRFNRVMMMNQSWDHIINETVPHELAHIICFATNSDDAHGLRWRAVCRALGGSAKRTHSESVVYANGNTYVYTSSTGKTVNLSEVKHRRIQRGTVYVGRNGMGRIDRSCAWSLLGQTPAVQPTKEVPVETLLPKTVQDLDIPGVSKAAAIRARIYSAKQAGEPQGAVIAWAMTRLQMSAALARTYVKNNWEKVHVR